MIENHDRDILLAGKRIEHRHVCAFFHSEHEEYGVLLPFIKEGLENGEKAFHIVDPALQQSHRQHMETAGLDTEELERRKQLEIRVWEETYLSSNGGFEMNSMLNLIKGVLQESQAAGYTRARLVGHMEWSAADRPDVKDLIEYEARLNYVLPQYNDVVICVYDLAKFSAGVVINILRTHPMVIIGGTLQINPFYVEPDELLKELEANRG